MKSQQSGGKNFSLWPNLLISYQKVVISRHPLDSSANVSPLHLVCVFSFPRGSEGVLLQVRRGEGVYGDARSGY